MNLLRPALTLLLSCLLFLSFGQTIDGELRRWHKVTLTFDGPQTSETATPNPFADYRMTVTFTHQGSNRSYAVPGYFAACGDAADNGCSSGNQWRVHFAPDRPGTWTWTASLKTGNDAAIGTHGSSAGFFDGQSGNLSILETNKTGRDFRAPEKGRLQYVGEHYLRHSGPTPDSPSGDWFFKAGADAPENMLSYDDFDAIPTPKKTWQPHQQDYLASDASAYTWRGGKGTEMLGMIRYLSDLKQVNAVSFLTFSLDGDDKTIAPHLTSSGDGKGWNRVHHDRFDVSKVDQWERVFEYADKKGVFLHFKTQETENDQKMDGGALGRERKLYYRELIARFGHHLALNWNLGEENTQTDAQRRDMTRYFEDHDPYRHHVVIHTYPGDKNSVYTPMLGNNSALTGASLQSGIGNVHRDVVEWCEKSAATGKAWVIANDEQGGANTGVDVDPRDRKKVREEVIWGTFLGGGMGFEYYYGYQTGCSDLTCQDHRTRDDKYTDAAYALAFMEQYVAPYLPELVNKDQESSQTQDYLLRTADKSLYVLYLPSGGSTTLSGLPSGTHNLRWFNPRNGQMGNSQSLTTSTLSAPGGDDWVALLLTNGTPPPPPPTPPTGLVLEEVNGVLAVEAEHFVSQSLTQNREWYLTEPGNTPNVSPDPDGNHAGSASGGKYLEILPDTRVTHSDPLVNGVSFSNTPGQVAVIDYQVYINDPGRYYVWVRAYSTGTEDNGVHVGLDGNWPASGQRMQWCTGKNQWTWESKQRTNANHCGKPQLIYLDINSPGLHTLSFSMREDGFEMDKFVLSKAYQRPNGAGPPEVIYGGGNNPCASNQAPSLQFNQPSPGFTIQQGSSLTLEVSVNDADNNVEKVEYFRNGSKIGETTQAPHRFPTLALAPGTVSFTAKVTDACGATATTAALSGTVTGSPPVAGAARILYVCDDPNNPGAGDQSVISRLQSMGHTLTLLDDDNLGPDPANGMDLIYLSSTVLSTKVGAFFATTGLPVVVCEPYLFDDMEMTGSSTANYGSDNNVEELTLLPTSHAITQGMSGGPFLAYQPATTLTWGIPLSSAVVLAEFAGNSQKKALFVYEAGASLANRPAPARRVGLWLYDGGLVDAQPETQLLWEQAVCWALGSCSSQVVPVTGLSVSPASLDLEVGDVRSLVATVTPSNATNPAVDWASSDLGVALVDATGELTALGAGTATLTATTQDGNFTATATVRVTEPGPGQTPFGGSRWPIPGRIEAEDYDEGGEGLAYADATPGNTGGSYRNDDVDIQRTTDLGGGYNVGWVRQGEWLAYSVEVTQAGDYRFDFRVASRSAGGAFHLELDGQDLTGELSFPATGGWQTWVTVSSGLIPLTEGAHNLRLYMDANSFNVNYFEASLDQPQPGQTQTVVLSPVHDAYLQYNRRYNVSLLRSEQNKRTTYLRFDLSDLPGEIVEATLRMTCTSDPGHGPITVELGDNSVWAETDLHNGNKPAAIETLATVQGTFNKEEAYEWSLGALPQDGMLNLLMNHLSGNDVAFASKEDPRPAYRPQLILTVEGAAAMDPAAALVDWHFVEGVAGPDQVQVTWEVLREQNLDYFALERSLDEVTYQQVGWTPSLGSTASPRSYTLFDEDALTLDQARFYRIRAVAASGFQAYSAPLEISLEDLRASFRVFPNPLDNDQELNIELEVPAPGPVLIRVFDHLGRLLLSQEQTLTQTAGRLALGIQSLHPGLYLINVHGQGWTASERFEVQ